MQTCAFDLAHYRELLEAARAGGYRFASFDRSPRPGDLHLRHDVAWSLEAALETARVEYELGARATYLLMTESVFYNLRSHPGERTLRQLRQWGHAVGLHAVYPRLELDRRFDPVVSWHGANPGAEPQPVVGAVNVMEPPYCEPGRFRADSGREWRDGCPHAELAEGRLERLQLLIHPELWVYGGETLREAMLALLDAKRELMLHQLSAEGIDVA